MPPATEAEHRAGRAALRRGKHRTRCRARCCVLVSPQGMEGADNFTCRIMIERDPDRNAAGTETGAGEISVGFRGFAGN